MEVKQDDGMLIAKDRALLQEALLDCTFAAFPGGGLQALHREIERAFKFPDDAMRSSHSAYTLLQFYSQLTLNSFIQSHQPATILEKDSECSRNFHESLIHNLISVESMMLKVKRHQRSQPNEEMKGFE